MTSRAGVRWTVATVIAAAVLWAAAGSEPASAHPIPGRPSRVARLVVEPSVTSARVCGDALVVTWDTGLTVDGRRYPLFDIGAATLDVQSVSGRWVHVSTQSGGEHVLRWPWWGWTTSHGRKWVTVRVTDAGATSAPAPISLECT